MPRPQRRQGGRRKPQRKRHHRQPLGDRRPASQGRAPGSGRTEERHQPARSRAHHGQGALGQTHPRRQRCTTPRPPLHRHARTGRCLHPGHIGKLTQGTRPGRAEGAENGQLPWRHGNPSLDHQGISPRSTADQNRMAGPHDLPHDLSDLRTRTHRQTPGTTKTHRTRTQHGTPAPGPEPEKKEKPEKRKKTPSKKSWSGRHCKAWLAARGCRSRHGRGKRARGEGEKPGAERPDNPQGLALQ